MTTCPGPSSSIHEQARRNARWRSRSPVVVAGILVSCSLSVPTLQSGETSSGGFHLAGTPRPTSIAVYPMWTAASLEPDIDSDELGGDIRFPDFDDSSRGRGITFELGNGNLGGLLSFHTSEHADSLMTGDLDVYTITAEGYVGSRLAGDTFALSPWFAIGSGVAVFDFQRSIHDDRTRVIATAGGGLNVEFTPHAILRASIRGFLWGQPGETEGTGVQASVGMGLAF